MTPTKEEGVMTDEEIRDRLTAAMESSARGNTYRQWADTILPTVREIADQRAAEELHKAADEMALHGWFSVVISLRARAYPLDPAAHGDPS